jgi:transposase
VTQQPRSTFVVTDPIQILEALVGLKDVDVLYLERRGPDVELAIEQRIGVILCPACHEVARVKDRPTVRYIDLPVYGSPMRLCWKKHRMRCVNRSCAKVSWMLTDHRIAAKKCLLTTRAAKWATRQIGDGRTIKEVAGELACDWHTVNDAVTTYGQALLEADRKRLNKTSAIGLDETSFVRLAGNRTDYATTVADVEHHQIIDILPSRNYVEVAAWLDKQPKRSRASNTAPSTCRTPMPPSTAWCCLRRPKWSTPSTSSAWQTAPSMPSAGGCRSNNSVIGAGATIRSIGPAGCCSWAKRN